MKASFVQGSEINKCLLSICWVFFYLEEQWLCFPSQALCEGTVIKRGCFHLANKAETTAQKIHLLVTSSHFRAKPPTQGSTSYTGSKDEGRSSSSEVLAPAPTGLTPGSQVDCNSAQSLLTVAPVCSPLSAACVQLSLTLPHPPWSNDSESLYTELSVFRFLPERIN